MKPAPILVYSVLRLLAFLLPLAILWYFFPIFREQWWLAAIFAALIGLSLSIIFLRKPLDEVSAGLAERRAAAKPMVSDEEIEDSAADAADAAGPESRD